MRLFVGIFPDSDLRAYFRDVRQKLSKFKRNFKFVRIDQIHLTIKFLGSNIDPSIYKMYKDRLAELASNQKVFSYKVLGVRFGFKAKVRPRVLFGHISENKDLNELTKIATLASKGLGSRNIVSRKDRKKLIHHFTLARTKSHTSRSFARDVREYTKKIATPESDGMAENIVIVQSKLTPKGPIYKLLDKIPLQK
ncbi:RNA 2',3'-cyclic phosphodiesterase [Candidatus Dojkabacteria bacterium]|nr:RNA 2',3'-cyclic phosphodiesterase [Candidatus Dojkabacteria bacterium]